MTTKAKATAGRHEKPVLITGGAGFIGTNLANRLALNGRRVLIYDNLSRPGVENNLRWLRNTHGDCIQVEIADVRDPVKVQSAVRKADQVFHFAAQVAVTTSLVDPITDFQVNAQGTFNVLEAIRHCDNPPPLVFTSTNKVYGGFEDVKLSKDTTRYEVDPSMAYQYGVDESRPLDFHSPYGCSKGTADQYVRDYARTYGLKTVVFRMSCIYGPHQCGTEDQGWVAHFVRSVRDNVPITLYGDGMQVRDVLFVEDLVRAFLMVQANISRLSGEVFNVGGGPENTISLLELIKLIGQIHAQKPRVDFDQWRVGDQRYYVSDIRKLKAATGWSPRVSVEQGVRKLYDWLAESQNATTSSNTQASAASASASSASGGVR